MSTPLPPPDAWQPPFTGRQNAAAVPRWRRSEPIVWTPKVRSPASTIVVFAFLALAIAFNVIVSDWAPSPGLLFLLLLLPTAGIVLVISRVRLRRHFPFTGVIDHEAFWVSTSQSPLITELSRRDGGQLRVTRRNRLWVLAVVRPDGTATAPILLAAEVLDALRAAVLDAGWAWQVPAGTVEYPAGWDPRPFPPLGSLGSLGSLVPLTPPVTPRRVPVRVVRLLVLLALSTVVFVCLQVTDSGVVSWMVLVVIMAALVLIYRRRTRSAAGRLLTVTPQALRITYPICTTVLTREASAGVVIDTTNLRILDQRGRELIVISCPAALPAVRAALTAHGWPYSDRSAR